MKREKRNSVRRKTLSVMIALVCAIGLLAAGASARRANRAGLNEAGTSAAIGTVKLPVNPAVTITTQPKSATVAVDSTAKFTVVATGSGKLSYQWQTKAPGSSTWKNSTNSTAKKQTLSITVQAGHHGYKFRCIVKDSKGAEKTSGEATLTVKPGIIGQTGDIDPVVGGHLSLRVIAKGKGTLKYQWQMKAPGSSSTWKNSTNATAKQSVFKITAQSGHNGYQFRCVVTDGNGQKNTSSPETITIRDGEINAKNFPDPYLRDLVMMFDKDGSTVLTWDEIEPIKSIGLDHSVCEDMSGIEMFYELYYLECNNSEITSAEQIKKLPKLKLFYCDYNSIGMIDVTKNPELDTLKCELCNLKKLNVTKNPKLEYLQCGSNFLETLNLTRNPKMKYVFCDCNLLKTLNLSNNPKMEWLYAGSNDLIALDVTKAPNLTELHLDDNYVEKLDISRNTELREMSCTLNWIKKLDVSKNTNLHHCEVDVGVEVTGEDEAGIKVIYVIAY